MDLFSPLLRNSLSLSYISLALCGLLVTTRSEGSEYVFENLESPYVNGTQLAPMRNRLTYHIEEKHGAREEKPKKFQLCDSKLGDHCLDMSLPGDTYVEDGGQAADFKICAADRDMFCLDDPSYGWVLYLPRKPSEWTSWKHGDRTYFFEGWQRVAFLPASKQVAVIHAFLTSTLEKKREAKALAYPVETYYVDQQTRLVGMVRYTLRDPEWTGLNENRIDDLYWAVDGGLPLTGEQPGQSRPKMGTEAINRRNFPTIPRKTCRWHRFDIPPTITPCRDAPA